MPPGAVHTNSRCDGRDAAPICCGSAAQSTTARSVPDLGIDLTGSPVQTLPLPNRHDPPNVWTVPLDSTFIRGCEDGEWHLEVRVTGYSHHPNETRPVSPDKTILKRLLPLKQESI
jgi:hypothetical protein